MPSFRCSNPTCANYLSEPGTCPEHQGYSQARFYDRHLRNPDARKFYNSKEWKRVRIQVLTETPWCICGRMAKHVHHRIPLAECSPAQKLDRLNLVALCIPCHNEIERGRK